MLKKGSNLLNKEFPDVKKITKNAKEKIEDI